MADVIAIWEISIHILFEAGVNLICLIQADVIAYISILLADVVANS